MEYKIKQDKERLGRLAEQITEKETALEDINRKIATAKPIKATFDEIRVIGKKKRLSDKIEMSSDDYDKLQNLAKEGLTAQSTIETLNQQIVEQRRRTRALQAELNNLYDNTKDFFAATRLAPEKVKELFADIFTHRREEQQKKQQSRQSNWSIKSCGRDAR